MATVGQLDEITQCPVCTDAFTDPRVLPCGHTFCLECIQACCKHNRPGNKLACPMCRTETTVPRGGIDSICPKNFVAVNLLIVRNLQGSTPTLRHAIASNGGDSVGAVACLADEVFVVRLNRHEVEVFDAKNFRLQRRLDVPGLGCSSFGMVGCSCHDCLYLSDYYNHCVCRVELSGTNAVKKWPVAHLPAGLSVNSLSNVVVTCHGPNLLQEYTTAGVIVREICLEAGITAPWHAVQLSTGDYAVSLNTSTGAVVVVGTDGQVMRRCQLSETSDVGPMQYPGSLAVTDSDAIIIADYGNNRILSADSSFGHIDKMPISVKGGIQGQSGLCLDQRKGRLYVGEWGTHRVLVFDGVH